MDKPEWIEHLRIDIRFWLRYRFRDLFNSVRHTIARLKFRFRRDKKYMTGLGRANRDYGLMEETHLYEQLAPGNPGYPLCDRGWNRDHGQGYSIFRGNVGDMGVCPVCEARAQDGRSGVAPYGGRGPDDYSPLRPGLPLTPDNLSDWDYCEEDEGC